MVGERLWLFFPPIQADEYRHELVYPGCGVSVRRKVWPATTLTSSHSNNGAPLVSLWVVSVWSDWYFMVGDEPSGSGSSLAQKAAKRQAKADAKAAKAAEKNAARDSQMYDDLDALDLPSSGSGGNMARLGALAGTGALIGGGLGWGIYEHKQYQKFETTYLTVWPECAIQCTADGVAYYDSYVWPHQRNRIIGFSVAGVGLVGMGVTCWRPDPCGRNRSHSGGLELGISGRF